LKLECIEYTRHDLNKTTQQRQKCVERKENNFYLTMANEAVDNIAQWNA